MAIDICHYVGLLVLFHDRIYTFFSHLTPSSSGEILVRSDVSIIVAMANVDEELPKSHSCVASRSLLLEDAAVVALRQCHLLLLPRKATLADPFIIALFNKTPSPTSRLAQCTDN